MRISVLSLVCLSLSMPQAFADRINECAVPGVKVSSEFLGLVSDGAQLTFSRKGSSEIPVESSFSAEAFATISKNLKNQYCVVENYKIEEQKCSLVDSELALGRGNATFKSFYNLSKPLLARAEVFMQTLTYDKNAEASVRLGTAKIIVSRLMAIASTNSIPTNWDEFAAVLNTLNETGEVNKVIIDELTSTYIAQNKEALGFNPMKDVEIKEENGNDAFGSLFDLSMSEFERAKIIQERIKGITTSDKNILAGAFITFASDNGIPANWNQFNLMLKSAVEAKKLDSVEYKNIVGKFEVSNRENLGFKVTATKCVMVQRDAQVNVLKDKIEKEFHAKTTKTINLKVTNAPLLADENESFTVSYDGLNPEKISSSSRFNRYEVSTVEGNLILKGQRLKVAAANTSYAKIVKTNDVLDVFYQNTNYNKKIDGKIIVIVEFYESRFWGDKLLASRIITPVDGNLVKYLAQVKMQNVEKTPYVIVKMKYEGSSFYNDEFTAPVRFDF